MILLTHLAGGTFYLNPDLVESVEATPDTVIVLTNGKRLLVQEPMAEVAGRMEAYRQRILKGWSPEEGGGHG